MSELRPGYKQTEVGVIPEDWEYKHFGDVFTGFSSGQTPSRTKPQYYRGAIPWITSGELNYDIIYDTNEKITLDAVNKTHLKILPRGTFLFAITGLEAEGTRGSCGITGIDAATNQSCMALFPTNKVITEYLFYYYVGYGKKLALEYCQGTKQQSYTASTAKLLPILLPPTLAEQTAIAEVLSDNDALILSLDKLIAKKRNIKQGAMQELLTGRRRLPGFDGDTMGKHAGYKQTEVGVIPEDWELKSLGEISDVIMGQSPAGSTYNKNGLGIALINGPTEFTDSCPVKVQWTSQPTKICKEDDILICVRGSSTGRINISNDKYCIGRGVAAIRAQSTSNTSYLNSQIRLGIEKVLALTTGSTFPNIDGKAIRSIRIPLPPTIAEQTAIAAVLSDMDAEIAALEQKRDKYKAIKRGMMQELLTGKIRLV